MYLILEAESIAPDVRRIVVEAPKIAKKHQAGQFVIVRVTPNGERIPLTIADYDCQGGTISLVVQEVGKTTMQLGTMGAGDHLASLTGPLGLPSEIDAYGTVLCVGGGFAIAPVYPIARALKQTGNTVISIVGVRSRDLLFWEDRMRAVSDELIVCTDDGSYGRKGFVNAPLREVVEQREIARVWVIGPAIMMKVCAAETEPFGVPTIVSLNTIMIDGTGMCGGCRVQLTDGAKFVCVDGPEFDAHQVDWDLLLARQRFYLEEEKQAVERWRHQCRLEVASG